MDDCYKQRSLEGNLEGSLDITWVVEPEINMACNSSVDAKINNN